MVKKKETPAFDHEGQVDIDATRAERLERDGKPIEYIAPGVDSKWRARDLVDIHWKLTGIYTPSVSYNRIMACIIGHANPYNGVCCPRQEIISAETDYSRDTINRAIKWWVKQGFLVIESRGLGAALAYHPQWPALDLLYAAIADEIEAKKEALSRNSRAASRGGSRAASRGGTVVPHQGATHNLKGGTSKKEPHH